MTDRAQRLSVTLAAAVLLGSSVAFALDQRAVSVGFVDLTDDSRHRPVMLGRAVLKPGTSAWDGARTGLADAKAASRQGGAFTLARVTVASADMASDAVSKLVNGGAQFILLDLPAGVYESVAAAVRGMPTLLLNVSTPDDELRRRLCAAEIAHVYPSRAMLADAFAQYVVARNWRSVLLLEGPYPTDAADAAAFAASAKKFGLRIIDRRHFLPGSDPRQREQNNPVLATTSSTDYDVIYVADAAYDFARTLPYHTARPRPVIGAVGLEAVAWHWTWERNGAPQVNSRYRRISGGAKMEGPAWAAWLALRMIAEASERGGADFAAQRAYLLKSGAFDPGKGVRASFRLWDQQLRQPILFATAQASTTSAPLPGFLHQTETLDTLGDDARESPCKLDR
jgi:ABC transporter substrate binding protein (PQQ-dependent alcohol dehydrogenase system)